MADLTKDLQRLSDAHGSHALSEAFHLLTRQIKRARKATAGGDGALVAAYKEGMRYWDASNAAGEPLATRVSGMDALLRDVWPKGRSESWRYQCEDCSDSGWIDRVCGPTSHCGRPFRLPNARADDGTGRGRCQQGHTYVIPCFCHRGDPHRKAMEGKPPRDHDFKSAGKGSTPTRAGR